MSITSLCNCNDADYRPLTGTSHDYHTPLRISSHFEPEMEPPAGIGPTGASAEVLMHYHRNFLPRIVVTSRIVVKVIIARR